jgi:GR25 family glycosyltransferase involved in LPS biosynthesis
MKIKKQEYEKLLKLGDQAFCSRLKRMTTHEDDAFFYVAEDLFRILLEQGDPRVPKISMAQKAKNLSGSMKKAASTPGGLKPVPKKVQEDRLATCGACELKHPKRWQCKKCGCRLKAKTKLRGFECPVGKWGQWSPPTSNKTALASEALHGYFDAVFCINLDRRPNRWEEFKKALPKDWPFKTPERWGAVDGSTLALPHWWEKGNAGKGAWGCYMSHMRLLEHCQQKGFKRVLILEDDCRFVEGFRETVAKMLATAPTDWEMMYLGGQHLRQSNAAPEMINEDWFVPHNVNRTHAFAIQNEGFNKVYKHGMETGSWFRGAHIDHHLGQGHEQKKWKTIVPKNWLASQGENKSDISHKQRREHLWAGAEDVCSKNLRLSEEPFVPILGLHSSGSSCLAGVVHALGIHLGNVLNGNFEPNFMHHNLCRAMQEHIWSTQILPQNLGWLEGWVNSRKAEAKRKHVLAGAKHPLMLVSVDQLINAIGDNSKIIFSERPLEDSIRSMIKRGQRQRIKQPPEVLEAHQRWLWKHKEEVAEAFPEHLRIDYYEVLENPVREAEKIAEFLGVVPSEEVLSEVIARVKPEKRRV